MSLGELVQFHMKIHASVFFSQKPNFTLHLGHILNYELSSYIHCWWWSRWDLECLLKTVMLKAWSQCCGTLRRWWNLWEVGPSRMKSDPQHCTLEGDVGSLPLHSLLFLGHHKVNIPLYHLSLSWCTVPYLLMMEPCNFALKPLWAKIRLLSGELFVLDMSIRAEKATQHRWTCRCLINISLWKNDLTHGACRMSTFPP